MIEIMDKKDLSYQERYYLQEKDHTTAWLFLRRKVEDRLKDSCEVEGKFTDKRIKRCPKCNRGWEMVVMENSKKGIVHYPLITSRNKEEKVCMACVIRGE